MADAMMLPMLSRVGAFAVGAAVFFGMAWVSLEWGSLKPSLLWLSTGAVTTVALHVGPGLWWWVIAGGSLGGVVSGPVLFDDTWPHMLGPVVGNTLESVLIVLALPLVLGASLRIRRTRDGLWVVVIVIGAAAIGGLFAVVGNASTVIGEPLEAWVRWTLGNSIGEFLLVPLVLFRGTAVMTRSDREPPVEMIVTFAVIAATAAIAVMIDSFLIYLVIPLVLWVAIRFGPVVAAPVAAVTVASVWTATARGHGPFVEYGDDPEIQAQMFTLSLTTCVIVGGAHAVRAWNDYRRLVAVLSALPDIVFVREREGGRLLSSWVPRGSEARANVLEPSSAHVSPTIDDEPVPMIAPEVVVADDLVFERRMVEIDDDRELDLYRDISVEQQALRELRLRREAVEDIRRAERQRLGQSLHDSPIQLLTAAQLRLATARTVQHGSAEHLDKVGELTHQAMEELRHALDELIPPDAAHGDVVGALGHHAKQLLDDGVDLELSSDLSSPPEPEVCETLYLIGREAVSNAALHAEATRLHIALRERDGELVLTVNDDGVGLPASTATHRGYGIGLMQQRARDNGWTINLRGGPDGGTTVTVAVPLGEQRHA